MDDLPLNDDDSITLYAIVVGYPEYFALLRFFDPTVDFMVYLQGS